MASSVSADGGGPLSGPETRPGVYLGDALPAGALARIERRLQIMHCKWDTQVGDQRVLAPQALMIAEPEWRWLCTQAEQAAEEISCFEQEIARDTNLQTRIGLPRPFRKMLEQRSGSNLRTFRFDFHPTASGWVISEVNSDVPGGYLEASHLPTLYQPYQAGPSFCPSSPLQVWGKMMETELGEGHVALLYAPGYLEDQQVVLALSRELRERRLTPLPLQSPESLNWINGHAHLRADTSIRFAAVVRFYQAEWLAQFPRRTKWKDLFKPNLATRVINPALSVISESKRLPLIFPSLRSRSAVCREMFASCADPRELSQNMQEDWVLKAAYANAGDQVYLGSELRYPDWKRLLRVAQRSPEKWVAQRRFETLSLPSSLGLLKPCLGIFVVAGHAAGAYVRLSHAQITDAFALEAPLLIVPEGNS